MWLEYISFDLECLQGHVLCAFSDVIYGAVVCRVKFELRPMIYDNCYTLRLINTLNMHAVILSFR